MTTYADLVAAEEGIATEDAATLATFMSGLTAGAWTTAQFVTNLTALQTSLVDANRQGNAASWLAAWNNLVASIQAAQAAAVTDETSPPPA